VIWPGCEIKRGVVSVGSHVFIGPHCRRRAPLAIGDYTRLAGAVSIVGDDHPIEIANLPMMEAGRPTPRSVTIGRDAWIGRGATILTGVTIGDGAIIGAGATVVRDVKEYTIVVSPPATELRPRFASQQDTDRHRQMLNARRRRS
jgi:acetyltransferase-like isoleucine patch superfamily enzyme